MADSFRSTATTLIQHDTNIWTYEGSLTMLNGIFRLPSRMTIIRLAQSNRLVVISPFPPTNTIKTLIAEIVQYIVIPNMHHTFWALPFLTEYPNAYLVATTGVRSNEKLNKRIHGYFTNDGVINNKDCPDSVSFEWPYAEIDFYCFYNVQFIYEVVFYHRLSSTLIVTDLAFNYFEFEGQGIRAEGRLFRFYLWLADGYRQACVTKPFKFFFRKKIDLNKDDFDQLMRRYHDFNRLIMAHGTVIQHEGYKALELGTYQLVLDLYEAEQRRKHGWSMKTKIGLVIVGGTALLVAFQFLRPFKLP
uniref:Phosphatidylinositol 3-kinase vps34 n=1 Tax=Philodina roseola TaxID=96448 RepID=G3KGX0_PHIRO|nr:phosphatidylinositol 3-kinase vps34 [Philodina roseola]